MTDHDPLAEAEYLNDYRGGPDGGCPVSTNCLHGSSPLRTDREVIRHLLNHSKEDLGWALLRSEAETNRLYDLIAYRYQQQRTGTVPYRVTAESMEETQEIDTVLRTVKATMKRVVPARLRKELDLNEEHEA